MQRDASMISLRNATRLLGRGAGARLQQHHPQHRILRSSSFSPTMRVKYITPDDLAAIIKSPKVPNKDYCIVDVRDDDWHGGNIKNAQNSPSNGFLLKVDQLVQATKNVPIVVFHCALSQVRGPKAARIYAETRDLLQAEGEDIPHEVLVLQGGFSDFQAKFRKDPELVENWDAEVWASEWAI